MNCTKCGKENDRDAGVCISCGYNLGEKAKQLATVTDEPEIASSENNIDLKKIKEKASEIGSELKEKASSIDVDDVKNKTKSFAKNEVKNYKNFKNLSLKQKIIRIAIPLFIFVIAFAIFSGDSKEDIAIQCAVAQVDSQTFGKYVEIYDPVCVDSDGKGRYIVKVTSENNGFETWWAVLVTLSSDGEKYKAIANYHGGGTSQEAWIEEYKTNPDYGWDTKNEIK